MNISDSDILDLTDILSDTIVVSCAHSIKR